MIKLDKSYWSNRYKQGEIGWDIGTISNPLKAYFDQLKDKNIRILIPGCGNGYEAEYLYNLGFKNTYVLDLVEDPMMNLRIRCDNFPKSHCFVEDIFGFKTTKKFDLIVEQTIFCAIDPKLRLKYIRKIYNLLDRDGKYVGLLFNKVFDIGPPFGGNKEEYRNLFKSFFKNYSVEDCYNSIESRHGTEVFISCSK